MPRIADTNQEVIDEFRANAGVVAAPYDNPPPMLLLHTIGRKTGRVHLVPMRAMERDGAFYVFGPAHGSTSHPDWYLNLLKTPEIVVEVGAEALSMQATDLAGEERDRIFAIHAVRFPIFNEYQERLERTIPVVRLSPILQ